MTYDSPLYAFGWKVIPEVASFKEEGLVTPEGWEGEKEKLKVCCSKDEMQECWPLHHQAIVIKGSRLEQSVL